MWRRATVCGQVAITRRDEGGRRADKFRKCVPHIAIADLDCVNNAFLHQLADQRLRANLCAASSRALSHSVVVVEVGTRGCAGRVHGTQPLDAMHPSA